MMLAPSSTQGLHFGEALDCDGDAKWTMSHAWRSQRWSTPGERNDNWRGGF